MTVIPADTEVDYQKTYLEMAERPSFAHPHLPAGAQAALLRAEGAPVWYFRALYAAVGRDYAWEDIDAREDPDLAAWLGDPDVDLYTLMEHGWPQGFFLLAGRESGVVDLGYFGLVPESVGRGLGGWLLKTAILAGWAKAGVSRMTVDTCTLDHPRALQMYQKHGFRPVRREARRRVLARDRDLTRIPD